MDRARRKLVSAIDGIRNLHTRADDGDSEDGGCLEEFAEEARASSDEDQNELEIEERIRSEHTTLAKIVRHGFQREARCMAFDPVQRLLAIGAAHGDVRLLGQAGVDYHLEHASDERVEFIQFLVNEGGLVTSLQDDSIHLWNYRQKLPEIVHSLQMSKEHIATLHLPFQSKWLYVGTDRGNVYFVSLSTFQLSAYVIMWNKAVDIGCRTHPGPVRQLALSPTDSTRLLLLYDKGAVVAWNLQSRDAERFAIDHSPAKCLAWHHDGRQFMCGHKDGSLTIWNGKKPKEVMEKKTPHSAQDTKACRPITHLWWAIAGMGHSEQDQMICFTGGTPSDEGALPAITVLRGKSSSVTVLEMDHPVVEVLPLCALPYPYLSQLPYAMAVLLKEDLLMVDLQANGYPCFESPHPFDLSESPVTALKYYADCPIDLIAALTLVGRAQRQKQQQGAASRLSEKEWPLTGGVGRECARGFEELLLTGHEDGSIKFWQASGEHLHLMYRLKTGRHFEKNNHNHAHPSHSHFLQPHPPNQSLDLSAASASTCTAPTAISHAVELMEICLDSRLLLVASSAGLISLFRFVKAESCQEIAVIVLPQLTAHPYNCPQSGVQIDPNGQEPAVLTRLKPPQRAGSSPSPRELRRQAHMVSSSVMTGPDAPTSLSLSSHGDSHSTDTSVGSQTEQNLPIKVRGGAMRRPAGYQPELVCQIPWGGAGGQTPEKITALALNSAYGVAAIGTGGGVALVDIVTASLIYSWSNHELHAGEGVKARGTATKSPSTSPRDPQPKDVTTNLTETLHNSSSSTSAITPPIASSTLPPPFVHPISTTTGSQKHSSIHRLNTDTARQPLASGHASPRPSLSKAQSMAAPGVSSSVGDLTEECNGELNEASRSSSTTSLEKEKDKGSAAQQGQLQRERTPPDRPEQPECVTWFQLLQSYSKRSQVDAPSYTLWLGMSTGWCLALNLHLPEVAERMISSVVVAPSGSTLRLHGQLLHTAFLDREFCLVRGASDPYRDPQKEPASPPPTTSNAANPDGQLTPTHPNRQLTKASLAPKVAQLGAKTKQLGVFVSESEIRVIALPTYRLLQARRLEIPLVKARASHVRGYPCLLALNGMGWVQVYSLPSLRFLGQERLFPFSLDLDDPVVVKFDFAESGMAMFAASSSEVQKLTVDAEVAQQVEECSGELFVPCDMPEPPKASFLRGLGTSLFGSAGSASAASTPREVVDLDAIFSEKPTVAGVSSTKSVARQIPSTLLHHPPGGPPPLNNMESTTSKGISAGQAAQQAIQNLNERQERLNAVVDTTEQLKNNAMSLQSRSAKLVEKYEKKRWWNL